MNRTSAAGTLLFVQQSRTYTLDHEVSLRHSRTPLRFRRGVPGRWWATRTPDGVGTLQVVLVDRNARATAWGPGAEWLLEQTPRLLGSEDDPEGFEPRHELIDRLARRFPFCRFGRSDRVFESVMPTILGQKVTTTEAGRSLHKILRRLGERAPGPVELWIQPSPQRLASMGYEDFHSLGVERKRAETIIRAAHRARRMEEVCSMSPSDGLRRLMAFRGIGIWTASQALAAATGDPDAIAVGDYHLPNTVTWALSGEPRGDDERMLELLEPYAGHRGRVIHLLALAHVSAPKYGPRTAPRSIEHL